LEQLVIAHDQKQGDFVVSDASDVLSVRRCIVCSSADGSKRWATAKLDVTQSVVLASTDLGDPPSSMCECIGQGSLWVNRLSHLENVLWLGETTLKGDCTAIACTLGSIKIDKGCDGNTIKNSIVGWIKATTSNNTIENCDVYDKQQPFRDLAKPGNGCFSSDPQFVDDKNFDYHLQAKSPCRRPATGGNLGFTYTPETIELMRIALILREKRVIKF
jgi:hypothetical protein